MSARHLEIRPISRQHWIVGYEGDVTPLSEHPTLSDARAAAINHARQFGVTKLHVHELDGERHVEHITPDFAAPRPADVLRRTAEPRP